MSALCLFIKKSEQAICSLLRRGDPAGIRTPDPLLKRQLLCRLSYRIGYIDNVCDERGRGWDGWTRTSG